MTLRARLTFLYSALLALVVLLFSLATSGVLRWTLRSQVDNTLVSSVADIRSEASMAVREPGANYSPLAELSMLQINSLSAPNLFVQIWLVDQQSGRAYLYDFSWSLLGIGYTGPLDPAALAETETTRIDRMINGHHLRVMTEPLAINGRIYGHIQVAASLRTVDAAINRLWKIMLIGGALSVLASLIIGDYLIKRTLQPVDTIAQTARQITDADDLGRRIPYSGPPDEIGQLAETFNATLARLEKAFNVQQRFVADVSHEMRTPLTTIQGNLDLMRRIGYDEEAMAAIDGEARRMSRLVNDLLLLAKADAGRLSLSKSLVEIEALVLEVYNQAHMLSNGAVELRLGHIDSARIMGDCDRLKQLLLNLVSNGLKYTPPGGSVTLSLQRRDGWVHIDVADTGTGIPESDLPHIFDRFYRVDKARARAMGGTGLGLSIAQWIAEAHGGTLGVQSTVGTGSTFTVKLPMLPDHVPSDSVRATIPNMPALRFPRRRSSKGTTPGKRG